MFAEVGAPSGTGQPAEQQLPRLLILRCASRKLPGSEPMPALQRYDGPAFRILRKYLATNPSDAPLIRIVSAEHGLMSKEHPIEEYDRRMDAARAQELRPSVLADLATYVQEHPVREVLVVVGQTYLQALTGIEQVLAGVPVRIAGETQGRKLGALRAWLYGESPEQTASRRTRPAAAMQQLHLVPSGKLTFRVGGREVTSSADEVVSAARRAIMAGEKDATRITRWYVPVDGERVSPKWLVAELSGVSPKRFQANTARSILQRLGVPVVEISATDNPRS